MLRTTCLSLLAALALLGCAKKDPLLGSWTTTSTVGTSKIDTTYTFKDDKTYKADQKVSVMGQEITATEDGTYTRDKDTLVITGKSLNITSQMPDVVKQQIKKGWEQQLKKPRTVNLVWDGDDKVTASMDGAAGSQTWARKK